MKKMIKRFMTGLLAAAMIAGGSAGQVSAAAPAQKIAENKAANNLTRKQAILNSVYAAKVKAGTDVGYVKTDLNLRSSMDASDSDNIVTVIPRRSYVDVLEKKSNGWYKVLFQNQTGYAKGKYMKIFAPDKYTVKTALRMRSSTSTESSKNIIMVIPKGKTVEEITKYDDGWTLVRYAGKRGFVKRAYLQQAKDLRVTTTALNLRSFMTTKTKNNILMVIPKGKTVEVLSEEGNGWAEVKYKNTTGFVIVKYLKKKA